MLFRSKQGDILIFLSGEREIREVAEALRKHHPQHTEILPLYSRLSASEQNRVFKLSGKRRIVLATNVAETSITVPGIRYVIDPGTARISRYSYRSKVQRLPIEKIAQSSANQRAGRCGRLSDGICIRLYSEEDFLARPLFTQPEIQRTNLAAVILQMRQLGLGDPADFPFIDPPDQRFINDGFRLLLELNAIDEKRRDVIADCVACHNDDEPHQDTMGTDCASCHQPTEWIDADFDHDTTDHPLLGKHLEASCLDCHEDRTFPKPATDCADCHADDDAHDGRSGNQCGNCHNPSDWSDSSFDHFRDAGFELLGRHAELACEDCHSESPFEDDMEAECASCHLEDRSEERRVGKECRSRWSPYH